MEGRISKNLAEILNDPKARQELKKILSQQANGKARRAPKQVVKIENKQFKVSFRPVKD